MPPAAPVMAPVVLSVVPGYVTQREAVAVAAEPRPVDAGLVRLEQLDFDDLRLQHHLPLDDQLGCLEVVVDGGYRSAWPHKHDPGVGIENHVAPVAGADDRRQRSTRSFQKSASVRVCTRELSEADVAS